MAFVSNLVGFCKKSSLAKLGKSETLNMFVTTTDSNEHSFNTILRPMPGYEKVADIPGSPQGTFRISRDGDGNPAVYGVWDKVLYLIKGDASYRIGEITTSAKVSFCETSGYGRANPHLVLCDEENVYCVDTSLTPALQAEYFEAHNPIPLPFAYPDDKVKKVKPAWVAYLYGYLVMGAKDTDIFYTSYQYPFEDFVDEESTEINYDVFRCIKGSRYYYSEQGKWTMSEWQPDNTVVGCSNGSRLFTLGTRSFQVFTFQDSVTQPFVSPDTASQAIGIKSKDSLAQYGSQIFWLGSADQGDSVIYTMGSDASPQRISTDEIEEQVLKLNANFVNAFTFRYRSHPFYAINFAADDVTFAYDIREQGWIKLSSVLKNGQQGSFRYCNPTYTKDGELVFQTKDALVKATEESWIEHDGNPILRRRAGGMLSSDHKVFKIGKLKILSNNGEYKLIKDRPALVTLRYTKDGCNWETVGTHSLGSVGNYDYDLIFKNLGKAKYLTVEVGTSENIPFALYGMDISATVCNGYR